MFCLPEITSDVIYFFPFVCLETMQIYSDGFYPPEDIHTLERSQAYHESPWCPVAWLGQTVASREIPVWSR